MKEHNKRKLYWVGLIVFLCIPLFLYPKDKPKEQNNFENYKNYEYIEDNVYKAHLFHTNLLKVKIGMNQKAVLDLIGRPLSVNTTKSKFGISEQWCYTHRTIYLYFENGILTNMQF